MEKSEKTLGQYIGSNHDYDASVEDFLKETAPLIGNIVHSFNSLDSTLNSAICELINCRSDLIGAIVIYKMNFAAKVDLFYRLVHSMAVELNKGLPYFEVLVENLKKCGTLRNAVVHAEWDSFDEQGYTYVKMNFGRGGMQQQYWQLTPGSLIEIESLINQTENDFFTFYEEIQKLYI